MTFINEYTQRLQGITLDFVSHFSKGRSRVWLMSKPSWTEWLANMTPWFQLTTYRRQQRTKHEGNTHGCIVHCIDTLELYTYIWAGKLTKFPTSVIAHSGFTKIISYAFRCFGVLVRWGNRVCGSFNERSTGGLALFSCFLPLCTLFCEGHQLLEIWPQYLAARPMCWTAGPALRVITPPSWSGNISGPVASGSTCLTEGILLRLGRYLNTSNQNTWKHIVCKNKCWLWDWCIYTNFLLFILCTIYSFKKAVLYIHNVLNSTDVMTLI